MALTPEEAAELAQLERELGQQPSAFKKFLTGASYAAQRASRGVADTAAWLGSDYVGRPLKNWAMSKGLVPSDAQLAAGKAATDEAGGWGTAGSVATDVGLSVLPTAKLQKAMAVRGSVPVLGDMAANVATSAAMAPDEEKVQAAVGGAIGTLGGRAAARVVGGPLRNTMTADSKLLSDKGITLPPFAAMSGTGANAAQRLAANAEHSLSKIPILGGVANYRYSAAIADYNKQQLNDILEPFGKTVTAGGRKGIDEAYKAMTQVFEEVTPHVQLRTTNARNIIDNFIPMLEFEDATLGKEAARQIDNVIAKDLAPIIARFEQQGFIDGPEAYKLGKKLDFYVKKYVRELSPDQQSMHHGFKRLRDMWFDAIEAKPGADPVYTDVIKGLQKAKRRWYNFRDAAEMTQEGYFTPAQVIKANKGRAPDAVTDAANHVLPGTAPEINIGSNAMLHRMVTPGGVSGAAMLGSYTGLGALTPMLPYVAGSAALYTKPALKYMEHGVTPAANMLVRKTGKALSNEELEFATRLMTAQALRSYRQQNLEPDDAP